jgi:hypothetical protein
MMGTKTVVASTLLIGSAIFVVVAGAHIRSLQRAPSTETSGAHVPVVVELFTSEACSSCPPADALLRKLDEMQPVPGTEIIALSEHVDYFDQTGWKDSFSSPAYTERQTRYAERMKIDGIYTPQMVVDGEFQFNGSDANAALHDIAKAAEAEKISVKLREPQANQKGKVSIDVQTGALRASSGTASADILIVVADDKDVTSIPSGENSGKTLTHVAVVREIQLAGEIDRSNGFSKVVETSIPAATTAKSRIVVIVQEPHQGRIVGAATALYPN